MNTLEQLTKRSIDIERGQAHHVAASIEDQQRDRRASTTKDSMQVRQCMRDVWLLEGILEQNLDRVLLE